MYVYIAKKTRILNERENSPAEDKIKKKNIKILEKVSENQQKYVASRS